MPLSGVLRRDSAGWEIAGEHLSEAAAWTAACSGNEGLLWLRRGGEPTQEEGRIGLVVKECESKLPFGKLKR